ncbi:MAG TPA: hypothetical protein PK765_02555 [bacterium]|nr:hypothetical protein [bacterium]
MGHLSLNQDGESTNTRITSYYMPQGYVNAEGLNRLVIFNPRGLKFTNHPASRDQVAARVVYDLHYSVPSIDGSDSQTSFNWSYTE